MTGYYHCRRKRDGVYCIAWFYEDASGAQKCSCCRTHACEPSDFEVLGPVPAFSHPVLVDEIA